MGIYILCFTLCIIGCDCYEKRYVRIINSVSKPYHKVSLTKYFLFVLAFLPPIILYGLRVDVGTDYGGYVDIYNKAKMASVFEYISGFANNSPDYYYEPGYYSINKIAYYFYDNAHSAFTLTGILIFTVLCISLNTYSKEVSLKIGVFIYLMTQFMYAVNGVRFAIACVIILYGFKYIIKNCPLKYLLCVIIATLFHKTAILCILFYILKNFSNGKINLLRNTIFYLCIIFTPLVSKIGMYFAKSIPIFSQYFLVYSFDISQGSFLYLWRILPSLLPVLFLGYLYRESIREYGVLIKILLCRIPLLYLGYYYVYLSRLDRFAWVSEIILVPLLLKKIKGIRQRRLATVYFILWYIFIFIVYYVVQATDLFPYRSIFH